ncbi:MAG: cyclic nucleotide-binding domain-containing protein [Chloroflexi bacterium]|nr:cyclic nucleotide-binding domain-containing protein [Chloroflexota bacterium]
MVTAQEERKTFLQDLQLFNEFEEEQIENIAKRLKAHKLEKGESLFSEGDDGDNFYIIQSGLVRVWRQENQEEVDLAILETGDYFGEEALLFYRPRSASITAAEDTTLLYLDETDFQWLLEYSPDIRENLNAIAETHQKARQLRFTWLGDSEVIHLILQRHVAHFLINLVKPGLVLLPELLLVYIILNPPTPATLFFSQILSVILLFVAFLMTIWYLIDWRNDYFIVTNQRVIWIEQVLLQSASRQEAPLSTIQSVNVQTSLLGRMMDYGKVIVRTYTGSLDMENVETPKLMQGVIEELLLRVRKKGRKSKLDTIRYTIRKNLGYAVVDEEKVVAREAIPPAVDEVGLMWKIFKTRVVEEDTFTYHKHWFSLLKKSWIPVTILITIITAAVWLIWRNFTTAAYPPIFTTLMLSFLGLVYPVLSITYQILDWRNDLYRVTKDQIVDREKKPFSTETINSAPLKNVLSLKHKKEGILGILLNYGSVEINVGDASLTFDDMHNPALVQQDIFYNMEKQKLAAEESEAETERSRMMAWLKTYHELRETEENSAQS